MAGKTPQRAAIYVRISDDREGQGLGVTRQEQDCRALAERLEWTLHPHRPVYSDNDIGASTKSRKARRTAATSTPIVLSRVRPMAVARS